MVLTTGLKPLSESRKEYQARLLRDAGDNPYRPEYWGLNGGEMPVIGWSKDFEKELEERSTLREELEDEGYSVFPWDLFRAIPDRLKRSDIITWNQGSVPSCSMHGAAHAFQISKIYSVAFGTPFVYDAVNPIYSFYHKKGNYSGGLDLIDTAEEINTVGFFPVSAVGQDNLKAERSKIDLEIASKNQAGIIRIEEDGSEDLAERIIEICRGLGSICFGSGVFFTSSEVDRNGVRIMADVSSGGHAQAFGGYLKKRGVEYVFLWNSHGERYNRGNGGEPETGAWCRREELVKLTRSMPQYGAPFVVFPEGELTATTLEHFQLPRRS